MLLVLLLSRIKYLFYYHNESRSWMADTLDNTQQRIRAFLPRRLLDLLLLRKG